MATRITQAPSNRQNSYGSSGAGASSVDVGNSTITRMAREDTRWFVIAVVVLSVVLFFALPMSLLVLVDAERVKAEVRAEIKQMKKLQAELKQLKKEQENE